MTLTLIEDKWLSERLGKAAWRLETQPGESPAPADLRTATGKAAGRCLVYVKVPAANVRMVHALETAGFRLVDTLLTLERPMSPPVQAAGIARLAKPDDLQSVVRVARRSFRFSRFHADPMIEEEVANDIKAHWAANFFTGKRGDAMVVAENQKGIAGFLQLLCRPEALTIDLIAVHPHDRRQGSAAAMIAFAQRHFPHFACIRVGTQAANTPAMRMYEHMGFSLIAAHHVFHYHAPETANG